MQYLLIDKSDTLTSISKIVGSQNIDALLAENGLERSPKIGKQWDEKCNALIHSGLPEVTSTRKTALLNSLTGSEDTFEKACLMDEDEWKIFSSLGSFKDALRVPETIVLPNSARVIGDAVSNTSVIGSGVTTSGSSSGRSASAKFGGRTDTQSSAAATGSSAGRGGSNSSGYNSSIGRTQSMSAVGTGSYSGSNNMSSVTGTVSNVSSSTSTQLSVDSTTYRAVMTDLKTTGAINPGIFNTINTSPAVNRGIIDSQLGSSGKGSGGVNPIAANLPWGKIQIYSSLLGTVMDIPAYPEELEVGRQANYSTMPDIIYQFEPWIVYQSSGPREQSLTFHLHRDMWSGNHLDGKANELVRFCEANTFPRYSGSAVLAPQIRIYINGALFISGVLTQCRTRWTGPIGQDGYYLEFELSLTIQEVSEVELNIDTVSKFGLIG